MAKAILNMLQKYIKKHNIQYLDVSVSKAPRVTIKLLWSEYEQKYNEVFDAIIRTARDCSYRPGQAIINLKNDEGYAYIQIDVQLNQTLDRLDYMADDQMEV